MTGRKIKILETLFSEQINYLRINEYINPWQI